MLERMNPDKWGQRKPDTVTEESLQKFMLKVCEIIVEVLANYEDLKEEILDRMAKLHTS